jgi:hypothetical protein
MIQYSKTRSFRMPKSRVRQSNSLHMHTTFIAACRGSGWVVSAVVDRSDRKISTVESS